MITAAPMTSTNGTAEGFSSTDAGASPAPPRHTTHNTRGLDQLKVALIQRNRSVGHHLVPQDRWRSITRSDCHHQNLNVHRFVINLTGYLTP